MRTTHESQRILTRRAFALGGLQLGIGSILASRLYYLQFVKAETYRTMAEDNRVNLQLLAPERGLLLDRNGIPLAENRANHRVLMERGERDQSLSVLRDVAKLLKLSPEAQKKLTEELLRLPRGRTLLLREYLSWDEVAALEFHSPRLPGISLDAGFMRYYPLVDKASHLIGFVGAVTDKDLAREPENKGLLKLPGYKIGKDGIEVMLEEQLRGTAGMLHMEMNAHGLPVKEVKRQPPVPGKKTTLTIDAELQTYAAQRFGEESGAAIIMRVDNGDVLALTSVPAFDPNRFSMGIRSDYWKELLANKKNPLMNKATAGQYPPGSTYKMLVGLAALEAGVITQSSRVYCPGHFFLGNHRFNCWKPEGHGSVNVVEAIAKSCDTFFYTMAQRLGIDKIAEMSRRFGLGEPTGIGLPHEKGGIMPDEQWKRQRYGQPWHPGDTINCGIGQGYVIATPMQLAVMVARLCTGRHIVPRLEIPEKEDKDPKTLKVDPQHLATIQQGMDAVCNAQMGTAYWYTLREGPFRMGGKTGTSQVRRILIRGQDQNRIPWEQRHHALFVGYAPVEAPKYACAVIVEHGGGGASAAAPVARDLLAKTLQLYENGPPPPEKLTPYS
jgi:penicillin-binding protein 2